MNATINDPCPQGCPWPARECCHPKRAQSYAAPILIIGGITSLGYVVLGAALILLGRVIWHATGWR